MVTTRFGSTVEIVGKDSRKAEWVRVRYITTNVEKWIARYELRADDGIRELAPLLVNAPIMPLPRTV
jgi:hypothetical protein